MCANHNRGLTWLNADQGQLFSLRNGIFGTMPVGLTGVTDYDRGYPRWYQQALSLTVHSESSYKKIQLIVCNCLTQSKRFQTMCLQEELRSQQTMLVSYLLITAVEKRFRLIFFSYSIAFLSLSDSKPSVSWDDLHMNID